MESTVTRRTLLKRAGAAGIAVAGGTLWKTPAAAAQARRTPRVDTPIEHLVIACQENRSYDHYFGMRLGTAGFGPAPGYTQPDGNGGAVAPFEFTSLSTPDIPHSWAAVHSQWHNGAMDGFYRRTETMEWASTPRKSCRSTTACSETPPSTRTTTARSSARPGRTDSTLLPAPQAASRRTASGATASSIIRSSSIFSTRRA
jgi:phosphoesterase family protein